VVIVDPDDIVRLQQGEKPVCKEFVNLVIALLFLPVVMDEAQAAVEEGPERSIGVTFVIVIVLGAGQSDGGKGNGAPAGDLSGVVALFRTPVPSEPDPA